MRPVLKQHRPLFFALNSHKKCAATKYIGRIEVCWGQDRPASHPSLPRWLERPHVDPNDTHTHTFSAFRSRTSWFLSIAAMCITTRTSLAVDPGFPRFRVTDLRAVGGMSALNEGTMGINNKGQVVYGYKSGGTIHAWLWLPETEYGFTGGAVYTIDSSGNNSIARDINEDGLIAGYSASGQYATIWTPASGSFGSPTLFATAGSEAYALDNESPPHVAGCRTLNETCGSPASALTEAFNWKPGDSVTSLPPTSSPFDGDRSIAYDIIRTGSDYIVGLSETCTRLESCSFIRYGTGWTPTPTANNLDVGSIRSGSYALYSYPYGINNAGNVAGWVSFQESSSPVVCKPTAAFWPSITNTSPVDLSAAIVYPNTNHLSRALAINSLTNQQVVGYDVDRDDALLWEHGSTWSCVELNDSTSHVIAECSDDEWHITEAHDINDNGWIVALGDRASDGRHSLLLTPVGCPWDVNEDEVVDEYDIAAIVAAAGDCVPAVICRADIDFDCDVDRDDGILLLEYLGECSEDPCPCEVGESFAMTLGGGLSPERFNAAIAELPEEVSATLIAEAWVDFLTVYSATSSN